MAFSVDIHNYDEKLNRTLNRLEKSKISERNKKFILEFDKFCILEKLSKPRRIKIVSTLMLIAKRLNKDFDKVNEKDLKNFILEIDSNEKYSEWTKQSYRAITKKFYKWLEYGDAYQQKLSYPSIVAWINTNIRKKDQPRIQASDILTEDEVERLMKAAEHPRDKAFISMLYELGARIGEIGNLKINDLSKDKFSYIIDLKGKTGHRTPRIVISDPYLSIWLNEHPLKNDLNAPLWIMVGNRNKQEAMKYGAFRALILRLKKKAGVKKRLYHHLFRHTRVTHLLLNKQINEAQAKVYFGWVSSSKMLSEYSHLISADVNDAILKIHGIKKDEQIVSKLRPKQCPRCSKINPKDAKFCQYCSCILDVRTAIELEETREEKDKGLAEIFGSDKELAGKLIKTIIKHKGQEWLKDFLEIS